jgi:hypothetical protein
MSSDWWSGGQRWLEREAEKMAASQKRTWVKRGRSAKTFRYDPPDWHRDAVAALGRNDEETFKAIKLWQLGSRGLPPLRTSGRTQNATKKSPAQLQREIDEVIAPPAAQGDRVLADLKSWGIDRAQLAEVREAFHTGDHRRAMALARDLGWNRSSKRGRAFR